MTVPWRQWLEGVQRPCALGVQGWPLLSSWWALRQPRVCAFHQMGLCREAKSAAALPTGERWCSHPPVETKLSGKGLGRDGET